MSTSERTDSPRTDEDALRATVRDLARDLGVRVAFICEVVGPQRDRARTLALSVDGRFLENLEYKVAGTPCERVYQEGVLFHPKDVTQIYPEDRMLAEWRAESYVGVGFFDSRGRLLGHLGVLHDEPIEDSSRTESKLRDAAAQVSREIERRKGSG